MNGRDSLRQLVVERSAGAVWQSLLNKRGFVIEDGPPRQSPVTGEWYVWIVPKRFKKQKGEPIAK